MACHDVENMSKRELLDKIRNTLRTRANYNPVAEKDYGFFSPISNEIKDLIKALESRPGIITIDEL